MEMQEAIEQLKMGLQEAQEAWVELKSQGIKSNQMDAQLLKEYRGNSLLNEFVKISSQRIKQEEE